ncbi:glycosyltransferase [Marinomonas primoryensis]|uniref:Putative transmembrane protein n=1 Tax=Marinomonas primoryensis TaxID=178399 RepID=A0A859CZF2_9GAMM|nr:glycosyltransferase [Marinomonas primoryensis]QKK81957.1 putative transmembrane protein [Marinomonas primoryensis]
MDNIFDVCVLIPAYNEGSRPILFAEEIAKEFKSVYHNIRLVIVIVDDGSISSTTPVVNEKEHTSFELKVIKLSQNLGKDHALFYGLSESPESSYYCSIDADGEQPASLLVDQWGVITTTDAQIVLARRVDPVASDGIVKRLIRRVVHSFSQRVLSVQLNGLTDCVMFDSVVARKVKINWKNNKTFKYIPWRVLYSTFFRVDDYVNFSATYKDKDGGSRFSNWRLLRLGIRCFFLNPKALTYLVYLGLLFSLFGSFVPFLFVLFDWFSGSLYPGYMTLVVLLTLILWSSLAILSFILSRLIIEIRSIQYDLEGS